MKYDGIEYDGVVIVIFNDSDARKGETEASVFWITDCFEHYVKWSSSSDKVGFLYRICEGNPYKEVLRLIRGQTAILFLKKDTDK